MNFYLMHYFSKIFYQFTLSPHWLPELYIVIFLKSLIRWVKWYSTVFLICIFFLLVRLGKKNLLHIFADNSVIFFKVSFCVLCLTCWVLSVLGVFFLSYYVWLVYIIKILKPCHICCKFFPSLLMKNITFKLDSLLFWKMCKFGTGGL